ncbi:hypothetical protein KR018_007010 [Drosophila ironensis]|nr:hypothetical protein KR018_007010 [Drosophila ironensis]
MANLVEWCIYISYFFGLLTGVLNFEVDWRTGRTRLTNRITIYAACAQIFVFYFLFTHLLEIRGFSRNWKNASTLHGIVLMVSTGLRIVCVFFALISRWWNRQRFIELWNLFYRLFRRNPDAIPHFRVGIASKCICGSVSIVLQMAMSLMINKTRLTLPRVLSLLSLLCLTAIINVIITQYYIVMAIIRGRYIRLKEELNTLMAEIHLLIPNRQGVFMTKCCFYADRLDEIAGTQSELQALTDRLSKTYELQVLCMGITTYFSTVALLYVILSATKYRNITDTISNEILVVVVLYLTIYYLDNALSVHNVYKLLNVHEDLVNLVKQRTSFFPGLDQRLQTTFENFQLNLARKPYRLQLFGAFNLEPQTFLSTANSLLINSIFLIQYDVENY